MTKCETKVDATQNKLTKSETYVDDILNKLTKCKKSRQKNPRATSGKVRKSN